MGDREYHREYRQKQRDDKNEVGKLPRVRAPKLRERMLDSLEVFLQEGFSHIFTNKFGPVQKDSIAHEQKILEHGGRDLNKLEPRGYGKSVRSMLGLIWAALKGAQKYSLLCQDSKDKADEMLELAHSELGDNEVLHKCFPETICFKHLDGNPHSSKYQTHQGKKTRISIKGDTIRFAKLDGFASSEAIIAARPFRKARGRNKNKQRPTVIVLDDVQTTEQAYNPNAVNKNLITLRTDIAFLGDRSQPISIINNATIIAPDDFPHSLTLEKSFRTVRYRMIEKFPSTKKSKELWEKYKEIRLSFDELIDDDDLRAYCEAMEFYAANRKSMDADSKVTWDYAYSQKEHDYEISTLQAAQNFIIDWGEDSFNSECQNEPPIPGFDEYELTRDQIKTKQHGQNRNVIPNEAEHLVVDIDVQGDVLFYTIAAASKGFDGFVTEYGTYPDQKRKYFTKSKLFHPLSKKYPGTNEEGRVYQGIVDCLKWLLSREFKRDGDSAKIQLDALGVDARWKNAIVKRAIRDVDDSRVMAYIGQGIGPVQAPMDLWKKGAGEQKGIHWHLRAARAGVRSFVSDVNFWKSFVMQHFQIPLGQVASLSIHKTKTRSDHALYADHIKSEKSEILTSEKSGRSVEVWTQTPTRDNDWLDTTAGAMALLSFAGAQCIGAEPAKKRRSKSARRSAVTYL